MRGYADRREGNLQDVTDTVNSANPDPPTDERVLTNHEALQGLPDVETEVADVSVPPQPIVRRGGTFESFKHPDFVWFWFGALVSNVGTWMQNYALGIVVFAFRKSEFDLGLINFISGIPVLFLAIAGGALADRVNRRKLLIAIQVVLIGQAAALGYLYNSGRLSSGNVVTSLAWVAGLGMVAGVFAALQFPAWQAMLPDLVPRESLLNGIALNSAQFQSSRLIGPLVAGALVVAGAGMGEIFYVNAVSFLFVIAALWVIRPREPSAEERARAGRRGGTIETLLGGLRYALQDRVVGLLILSTAVMTVFGFPYMTLLPAIIDKSLGFAVNTDGYNRAVAIVMAANGLGAMVGALSVASLPPTVRRNRIIPIALLSFGVLLLAFALSRTLWLSAVISALRRCRAHDHELARQHVRAIEHTRAPSRQGDGIVHHVVHGDHADLGPCVRCAGPIHRTVRRCAGRGDRAHRVGSVPCLQPAAREARTSQVVDDSDAARREEEHEWSPGSPLSQSPTCHLPSESGSRRSTREGWRTPTGIRMRRSTS